MSKHQFEMMELDPKTIVEDPDNFNRQDEHTFHTLVNNIKKEGQLASVPLVRKTFDEDGDHDGYMCVDGHHRIKAYLAAGLDAPIRCLVTDMDAATAKQWMMAMNKLTGDDDDILLGSLIADLMKDGVDLEEIAENTGYRQGELDVLLEGIDRDIDVGELDTDTLELDEDVLGAEASGGGGWMDLAFYLSESQYTVVKQALDVVIESFGDEVDNPSGNALELVCADFLAGIDSEHLLDRPSTVALKVGKETKMRLQKYLTDAIEDGFGKTADEAIGKLLDLYGKVAKAPEKKKVRKIKKIKRAKSADKDLEGND